MPCLELYDQSIFVSCYASLFELSMQLFYFDMLQEVCRIILCWLNVVMSIFLNSFHLYWNVSFSDVKRHISYRKKLSVKLNWLHIDFGSFEGVFIQRQEQELECDNKNEHLSCSASLNCSLELLDKLSDVQLAFKILCKLIIISKRKMKKAAVLTLHAQWCR